VKMNWKRNLAVVALVALLLVSLAGCGGGQSGSSENGGGDADTVYHIKFGHNQDTNSPQHRGVEAFKQKVEELSNGRVQVTIYPNMQLGQMREQAEQCASGTLEMTQQPTSVLSNFNQALEVYDIPFAFDSMEAMEEIVFGPMGEKIHKGLEDTNMVALGVETLGFKNITANFPIKGPDSLKGKKIRVMPAPILIETYEAFGANPTPIEYGELYNALQQGVVDGQENAVQTYVMLKFWEVQDWATMTDHAPFLYITVANKQWLESLPPDIQENIREAALYASKAEWEEVRQSTVEWMQTIQDNGMQVYYPTEEEIAAFKAASQRVVDFVASRVGQDLVDEFMAACAEANQKYPRKTN